MSSWAAALLLSAGLLSCAKDPVRPTGATVAGDVSGGARTSHPIEACPAPGPASSSPDGRLARGLPETRRPFFPLRLGNRWNYSYEATYTREDCAPELGSLPPWRVLSVSEHELTCTRQVAGRLLFVDRVTTTVTEAPWISVPQTGTGWLFYRQDEIGLYLGGFVGSSPPCEEVGTPVQLASARAAVFGGPFQSTNPALFEAGLPSGLLAEPGRETKILSYPLHVGARWAWDPNGLVGGTVEAVDVLDLAIGRVPAYRIGSYGLPPGWKITWWYSRAGLLKRVDHWLLTCIDPVCGCDVVYDATTVLTHVDLVGPGRW